MKTMIISAFPGCGKTYIFRNQEKLNYKVLDSDSSKFEKHEGWEAEYVNYISSNIGKYDFILIAQYPKVLEELKKRNIDFIVVAPDNSEKITNKERQLIKQQWFGRFVLRDNHHIKDFKRWINELRDNYENWTTYENLTMHKPMKCVLLKADEYLSDKIEELYREKEKGKGK